MHSKIKSGIGKGIGGGSIGGGITQQPPQPNTYVNNNNHIG